MKTAEDIVSDKKADIVSVGMISIGDVLRANLLEKEQHSLFIYLRQTNSENT